MPSLRDTINAQRRLILEQEQATSTALLQEYAGVHAYMSLQLDTLSQQIEDAQRSGTEVTESWLYRQARLSLLLEQVQGEVERFAEAAEARVALAQVQAVHAAAEHSRALITASLGPTPPTFQVLAEFTAFNPANVEQITARLAEGSPVRALLQEIAPDAVEVFRSVWVNQVVQGLSPRTASRQVLQEVDNVTLARSLTITRTEVLGAYREAHITSYQDSRAVDGWVWTCARSARTCAMCMAMDGRVFPTSVPFGSHPNCRCSPRPRTKSWEQLGFKGIPDRRPTLEPAEDWLSKQPTDLQVKVLGREKQRMWATGDLRLEDLIGYRDDPEWGPNRWERSLRQVRSGAYAPPEEALGLRP